MSTIKITLAYDGAGLVGWQRQASGTSVQGLIEDALKRLDERDVTVHGAGRTDAGVHALGQVASFSLARPVAAAVVQRALNSMLPPAVRVLAAEDVPDAFHARFDARAKTYRYRIWNAPVFDPFEHGRAWHIVTVLDVEAMREAARRLEGQHDFAAFQSAGSDVETTVRRIITSRIADCGLRIGEECEPGIRSPQSAIRSPQSSILNYEITGDGFLRHMVRAIVGSLVEIGRGRRPAEWIADVLTSRDRDAAGPTAPAEGLFLVRVAYEPRS